MDQFEIAATLVSFIYALAVTHVLQSVADIWSARARVRITVSHVIWMLLHLIFALATWLAINAFRDSSLVGWRMAALLAFAIGIYFGCALVSPRVPDEGPVDLRDFEVRQGPGYKPILAGLMLLGMVLNFEVELARTGQAPDLVPFLGRQWEGFVTIVLVAASLWRRERWVRIGCALLLLAIVVDIFIRDVNLT